MTQEEHIREAFPELDEIREDELRNKVVQAMAAALERGGWESIYEVPFTLLIPNLERDFVDHTRVVTKQAMAIAMARGDLNIDIVVAGALLHDVGKLLEYDPMTKKKSAFGALVRHPVSGAGLAMEFGLPDEVTHIIAAHSKEGEMVKRTAAAVLIHHCDFIDFEIEKTKHGM